MRRAQQSIRTRRQRQRLLLLQRRRRERERARKRTIPLWWWGPIGLFVMGVVAVGVAAGAAYGVYRSYADDLVEPDAILVTESVLGTSKVFDREGPNGTLLFEFADPLSGLRNPVRIDEISAQLINATVSTEDASFFENRGINLRGVLRAGIENLGLGDGEFLSGSGGSSITQQLVKNVLIPVEERTERSVSRKIKETILAVELTNQFSKPQILEWYLNTIFYGNLAYGIGAASSRYFGKPPSELTLSEAALLAGLPQAPATYDPFNHLSLAKGRQAEVLDLMVEHGYISRSQAELAKGEPLQFVSQEFDIVAPHFVFYVRDQVEGLCERGRISFSAEIEECSDLLTQGGLRITTTLDLERQASAEEILRADLASFEEQTGAHNASLIAISPVTGEILAMVGSRDFFREDIEGQVNLTTAFNSPGSAFKPLTYVTGFIQDPERWNPATIIWDVPLDFLQPDGTSFSPVNFDGIDRGPVAIRSALANSMNIPAFRAADQIGVTNVLDVAHRMGITSMRDPSQYGPSLTLGGGDVSLLDLAYSYSVLANNGVMRGQRTALDLPVGYRELDPIAILEITDSRGRLIFQQESPEERQVIPEPQAYQITHILSDNQARSVLYGLNSTLVLDRPAAAKTGTAGDPHRNDVRRDFWTLGYTPDLVVGVWVGNADNSPMGGGSSSQTAGLIWHDFMLAAHEGMPPAEFVVPEGLTTSEVQIPHLTLITGDARGAPSQDPCANRATELFVQGGVPEVENLFCFEVEIDRSTLLIADETTDEAKVKEGFFLIPPIAVGQEEPDEEILKWLRSNKVLYVRHESEGEIGVIAAIDTPVNGAVLDGEFVIVRGRATGEEVTGWFLAYAPGPSPEDGEFTFIAGASGSGTSGQLERWDIRGVDPGPYVLRLIVEDDFLGETIVDVHVRIAGDEESEGVDPSGDDPAGEGEGDPGDSDSGEGDPGAGNPGEGGAAEGDPGAADEAEPVDPGAGGGEAPEPTDPPDGAGDATP